MPRVSKNRLSSTVSKTIQKQFVSFIEMLDTQSEIAEFLNSFLTKEEKLMLSKRLMLYILINRGISSRQISRTLKMSRVTEYNHRQKWELTNPVYKKIIVNLTKKQKNQEFLKKLDELLYPLEVLMKSRSNMQARAKLYQGDFKKPKRS